MNPRLAVFSILFAPVFGFSLYLLACTASISPRYQPDIIYVRCFSPFLVLIFSFGIALFLARNRREITRFVQIALVLCAIVFVLILSAESRHSMTAPILPEERTLSSTVHFALAQPQFSNRSFAAPIYSAVLASILWLVDRARRKPDQPPRLT